MRNTFLWLQKKTFEELIALAKRLKITLPIHLTRNRLLSHLNQALSRQKKTSSRSEIPVVPPFLSRLSPLRERLKKKLEEQLRSPFELLVASPSREIFIDRGLPIPEQYFEDFLELMPISPDRIYAYWELSSSKFLNLQDQHGRLTPLILKLQNRSSSSFDVFEVAQEVTEFYFSAKPHQTYQLSLYLLTQQGQLHFLLESGAITTPAVTPSVKSPEKWLLIGEDSAGKRMMEPGILVETEPRSAIFVPIAPTLSEKNTKEFPVRIHKKATLSEPSPVILQEKVLLNAPEIKKIQPRRAETAMTPSPAGPRAFVPETFLESVPSPSAVEKKFDLFSSIARNPEGAFPNSPSEVLIYRQEGSPEQLWIQEKTGERWYWVPVQEPSFQSWIQGQPVHWVEGESGAWIQFAPGTGPVVRPGKISWYWGERQGESWYFQEGETSFHQTWLPQPEVWSEMTPSIRWMDGGQEEGTLVLLEDSTQEFVVRVIEDPYLVIGSSEMRPSSHSWITSFGLPRWSRPLSSWKFPISSVQRIPTSGQRPVISSGGPQWKRVSIPPSSWSYPIARPEVSSWIFPYREQKIGRPHEWVPLSSHSGVVSSWAPRNWPISSWTQPYLRWVYPEEIWTRPLLNWPSGIGMGSSEMGLVQNIPVSALPEKNRFLSELPVAKAVHRTSWKKIPRKQVWELPSVEISPKPKKV